MAESFGEQAFAARFRDYVTRTAEGVVERLRPPPRYATVKTLDRPNRRATVRFPGDTQDTPVKMGAVQPSVINQVVRIEGLGGDRYIADVNGAAYFAGAPDVALPTVRQSKYFEGTGGTLTITPVSFGVIPMTNVVSDPENLYADGAYTVPATGIYECIGRIRVNDGQTGSIGVGLHTALVDHSSFLWFDTASNAADANRHSFQNVRTGRFAAGEKIRLYAFSNLSLAVAASALTIRMVATD